MGLGSSCVYIGNNSSRTILARAAQLETRVRQLEVAAGFDVGSCAVDGSFKETLEHHLDVTGFARIGPGEVLAFVLPEGHRKQVYVSVTTDEPTPLIICRHYPPPHNKSVVVTNKGTVLLSKRRLSKALPPSSSFMCENLREEEKEGSTDGEDSTDSCEDDMCDDMGMGTWVTEDGMIFTSDMVKKIHLQSDIDKVTSLEWTDLSTCHPSDLSDSGNEEMTSEFSDS